MQRGVTENRFIKPVQTTKADDYVLDFTLDEVKEYLIVTHDEDNRVIQEIIDAVVGQLEKATKRPFSYTNIVVLAEVNQNPFYLPRLPYVSDIYAGIKVGRGYDGYEALTSDEMELFGDQLIIERLGIMLITYKAGYAPGELPPELRKAAFAEIAYRYENRGDTKMDDGLSATACTYIQNFIVTSYIS